MSAFDRGGVAKVVKKLKKKKNGVDRAHRLLLKTKCVSVCECVLTRVSAPPASFLPERKGEMVSTAVHPDDRCCSFSLSISDENFNLD